MLVQCTELHLPHFFWQCPSLRHLSLHCHSHTAVSDDQHSHSSMLKPYLRGCVFPTRTFHASELKPFLASPHLSMGRLDDWRGTSYYKVASADHHKAIAIKHFPQLHQLVIATRWNEMDYLEPSICLIRAHPNPSKIILYSHDGACDLFRSAFQPAPAHGRSTIHPSVWNKRRSGAIMRGGRCNCLPVHDVRVTTVMQATFLYCRNFPGGFNR